MSKQKFEVGQRVLVVNSWIGTKEINVPGTILSRNQFWGVAHNTEFYGVALDKPAPGSHKLDGKCPLGNGMWLMADDLKPLNDTTVWRRKMDFNTLREVEKCYEQPVRKTRFLTPDDHAVLDLENLKAECLLKHNALPEFGANELERVITCTIDTEDEGTLCGVATCSPEDRFNIRIGMVLALRRALGKEDYPNWYFSR